MPVSLQAFAVQPVARVGSTIEVPCCSSLNLLVRSRHVGLVVRENALSWPTLKGSVDSVGDGNLMKPAVRLAIPLKNDGEV